MPVRYVANHRDHAEANAAFAERIRPPRTSPLPNAAPANAPRPNWARGVVAWVLFVGLCAMALVLLGQKPQGDSASRPPSADAPPPTPHRAIGLSLMGCGAGLFLFLWFVWLRRLRMGWRGCGETVVLDEVADGLSFTGPYARLELPWQAFDGFFETPRLFVLHHHGTVIRPVPKDAFAGEGERSAFARTLADHLRDLRAPADG